MTRNTKSSRGFILEELGLSELRDSRIYVVITWEDVSNEAVDYANEIGIPEDKHGNLNFYEDWPELPKNRPLIDIYWPLHKPLQCNGVYTITHDKKSRRGDGSRVLLNVCQEEDQIMGRRFGSKECRKLEEWLESRRDVIWRSECAGNDEGGTFVPLTDFVDKYG